MGSSKVTIGTNSVLEDSEVSTTLLVLKCVNVQDFSAIPQIVVNFMSVIMINGLINTHYTCSLVPLSWDLIRGSKPVICPSMDLSANHLQNKKERQLVPSTQQGGGVL